MTRRGRLDTSGDTTEPLLQQAPQRPARTVPREHVEIVDVDGSLTVRLTNFLRVYGREPVIRGDLARGVENHPAQGIPLVGIRVDAPVGVRQVLVNRLAHIHGQASLNPVEVCHVCRPSLGAEVSGFSGTDRGPAAGEFPESPPHTI